MLERIYRDPDLIRRLRSSALGESVETFAAHLMDRGHRERTMRDYLRAVGHFARWLSLARVAGDAVDDGVVETFLGDHLPTCECARPRGGSLVTHRASLHALVAVMRPEPLEQTLAVPSSDPLLIAFAAHLRDVRGASRATLREYLRPIERLRQRLGGEGELDPSRVTPHALTAFVVEVASHHRPATAQLVATALRSFLRFLSNPSARGVLMA